MIDFSVKSIIIFVLNSYLGIYIHITWDKFNRIWDFFDRIILHETYPVVTFDFFENGNF